MATILRYLGASLLWLPYGETVSEQFPERPQWIQHEIKATGLIPGVVTDVAAGYTGYGDTPSYSAARALAAADFMPVVTLQREFAETYPVSSELRRDRPWMGAQYGLPAPLDLVLYTFHQVGGKIHDAVTEAKARQIRACNDQAPGDLLFQIESPAAVSMTVTADDPAKTADWLAGLLTALPAQCPRIRFGLHLCDGDWFHKAMTKPPSALPLVLLAAAVAAHWPTGPDAPVLDYIHFPCAPADIPPSLDPAWYVPFGFLRDQLAGGTRVCAGFVHELMGLPELRRVLRIVESAYGAEVTIAASCGLGRYPNPAQAVDTLAKMADLAGVTNLATAYARRHQ